MYRSLGPDVLAKLEAAYRDGKLPREAAMEAGCCEQTARNKFVGFRLADTPRLAPVKRKRPRRVVSIYDRLPRYTGPTMIGKAIPSKLPVDGWIGKR